MRIDFEIIPNKQEGAEYVCVVLFLDFLRDLKLLRL